MTAETSVPSSALLAGADRDGSNYTARHLLVLEGLEAVRKRPGMYIGSTDSRGLMHCVWEIIDNSVDEALGGHCDRIEVILHEDALRRGARQRPRHPGRRRAQDRPVRRRGRHDQAARRRQVRRRLLRRLRRSARRRRLRGQRAVRAARRRGGPRRPHARDQLPARRSRHLHRVGPGRALRPGQRADARPRRSPRRAPAPGSATGRTGRSSSRTPSSPWTTSTSAPGRPRSWSPASPSSSATSAASTADRPVEETFHFDGGISEFCEYLAPDKPICDVLRLQRQRHLQGDRARSSTTAAT